MNYKELKLKAQTEHGFMCRFFKAHYRLKSGSCKWRCISIKGCKYHLALKKAINDFIKDVEDNGKHE